MGLREVGFSLPPGFRFHPSDEELVGHYLYNKVSNERASQGTMVEVDLHTQEPWELPEVAMLTAKEWYFFSFRDRKYATGSRTNRATKSGYWKATGKDRAIYSSSSEKLVMIGMRKTLVFYLGRAPNGAKTNWVMHEFRIETPHSPPKEDWVLCRVFHKKKMEEEKETSSTFYTSSPAAAAAAAATPAALWNPVPFNEEVNGCSFSTITTYLEEDNKNSSDYTQNNNNNNNTCLMQNFLLQDLTCYQKDMGPKSGNDEAYGLLWDVDFGHGDAHI